MAVSHLLNTSAYWRIQREEGVRKNWQREIIEGGIALTEATRFEILYSSRNGSERMEMAATVDSLFPEVAIKVVARTDAPSRCFLRLGHQRK
jgi:hypothetical protein